MWLKVFLKRGERQLMWLQQFKIALAEQNSDSISKLLDEMPAFEEVSQMREAQFLIAQAFEFIGQLKEETASTISQIKKSRDYLRSTDVSESTQLNVST